jgi:hypothetical protein
MTEAEQTLSEEELYQEMYGDGEVLSVVAEQQAEQRTLAFCMQRESFDDVPF